EDWKIISKWLKELKQTIADDARTAKAMKTYVNQKTEDILQRTTKTQKKKNEMKDQLTKEQDKSAGLQSALHALKKAEYSNIRKRNEKLPITSTA
ncbi:hypothetical protein HN011_002312, partial [Eciton burchellii]